MRLYQKADKSKMHQRHFACICIGILFLYKTDYVPYSFCFYNKLLLIRRIIAFLYKNQMRLILQSKIKKQNQTRTDSVLSYYAPYSFCSYLIRLIIYFYFLLRRIREELYFFGLRVNCPKVGRPHGVTGRLRPIGARPSPPPCG